MKRLHNEFFRCISIVKNTVFLFTVNLLFISVVQANPKLVKDIAQAPVPASSDITFLTEFNDITFFTAYTPQLGREIWVSDGTQSGTHLLKDIIPGERGISIVTNSIEWNGMLYFVCSDLYGDGLWKSDGTSAGTSIVKRFPRILVDGFILMKNKILFTVLDDNGSENLWATDGTEAGTILIMDHGINDTEIINDELYFVASGRDELWRTDGTVSGTIKLKGVDGSIGNLTPIDGVLYFAIREDGNNTGSIWKIDRVTGPVLVKSFNSVSVGSLTDVNGTIFFIGYESSDIAWLWKSNGTEVGTIRLKAFYKTGNFWRAPTRLINVNGILFFIAYDNVHGQELWKSDGTGAGTKMVKDIASGSYPSFPEYILNASGSPHPGGLSLSRGIRDSIFNGELYFTAIDGVHGRQLWKTDGTEVGTIRLTDINDSAVIYSLTPVGNTLYFQHANNSNFELWKTEGTVESTEKLNAVSNTSIAATINGILYFFADDGIHGRELWRTNGTQAGTFLVKDINPVASGFTYLSKINYTEEKGDFYFTADDGENGLELWKSDGTTIGTTQVININPEVASSNPGPILEVNDLAYFMVREIDGSHGGVGRKVWKTDGTEQNTMIAESYFPEAVLNYALSTAWIKSVVNIDDIWYFFKYDTIHGRELWKSDGTEAGTVLVKDINPGNAFGVKGDALIIMNGEVYFTANDGVHGEELWKSDGTENGTMMVKDIVSGGDSSTPISLINVNGTLYFGATGSNGTSGELWKSDGYAAGTVRLKSFWGFPSPPNNLTNVNGTLFFSAKDSAHGHELWKSDGTSTGTVLVKDIYTGDNELFQGVYSDDIGPSNLTELNGDLYFVAKDNQHGVELWKSDGTSSGTVLVKDIFPGVGPDNYYRYSPRELTKVNGLLYFVSNDGVFGTEVWQSDGTEAGTQIAFDLVPGSGSSRPEYLTAFKESLLFSADDGVTGQELWKFETISAPICNMAPVVVGGNCAEEVVVRSIEDIDAYVDSIFGKTFDANGKAVYKNLRILGDLGQAGMHLKISTPCSITVNANSSLIGSDITLHARQGLNVNWSADIHAAGEACLIADKQNVFLNGGNIVNADTLAIRGNKKAIIGFRSDLNVNGEAELISTGTGGNSIAKIGNKTIVTADNFTMKADNSVELAFQADVSTTGKLIIKSGTHTGSETQITNRSSVRAGTDLTLSSNGKTTIGYHATVTAGNNLDVNASTNAGCSIASTITTAYSSKSGNCAYKLP